MLMSEKDRQAPDMHVARRSAIGSLSILRLTKRQCACSPFSCTVPSNTRPRSRSSSIFSRPASVSSTGRRRCGHGAAPRRRRGRTGPSRHGRRQLGAGILGIRFGRGASGRENLGLRPRDLTTAAFRQHTGTTWSAFNRQRSRRSQAARRVWATSTATTSRSRLPDARASIGSVRPASSCPLSNSRFSGAWSPYGSDPVPAATPRIRFARTPHSRRSIAD